MGGDSNGEEFDEFKSCSLSADVSEYESLSCFSSDDDIYGNGGVVSSPNYSPIVGSSVVLDSSFRMPAPVTLPVFGGGREVVPPRKAAEADLSGSFCTFFSFFLYFLR